jgi:glycosyltransferase involved in cell wall biosynthesis
MWNEFFSIVSQLVFILAIFLSIPAVALVILTCAALFSRRSEALLPALEDMRLAILVPAHNESHAIVATIQNLLPQLGEHDQLIVVSDNSTDDTAAQALAAGAIVIERHDSERRGKGYALAFGIDHLKTSPPDVVMVIDADCLIEGEGVRAVAALALRMARPIQMLDLMLASQDASARTRIMAFAWLLKNLVRPRGMDLLGRVSHLMGTGMAFPWAIISSANLASGHIAEDMKLGVDLTLAGSSPLFTSVAKVISYFPGASEVAHTQKSRWEHGHIQTMREELPRILASWLSKPTKAKFVLALDLTIPPTTLYIAIILTGLLISGITSYFFPVFLGVFLLFLVIEVALSSAILASWWYFGRATVTLSDLATIPGYLFWKLPIYLAYIARRRVGWIRTPRD